MAAELQNYNDDGASKQAQAVLAFVQYRLGDGIEESWSNEWKHYTAHPTVARWENCREQGYIISLRHPDNFNKQLNIAFFEHRNSDEICAIKWHQTSLNSLTIDSAEFGDECYSDKFDVSHSERYGEAYDMASWIAGQLEEFYAEHKKVVDSND